MIRKRNSGVQVRFLASINFASSVYQHVTVPEQPNAFQLHLTRGGSLKFNIFQFWLKSGNNNGHLHEDIHAFLCTFRVQRAEYL
jgi:hypothetical protein